MRAVDESARRVLRQHGWNPGPVLGAGMEGTVIELSAREVAKVWHGRSRDDLHTLHRFGRALSRASLPFAAPWIVDLLNEPDVLITIERRVPGESLRSDRTPTPPVASSDAVRLLGDALDGLSRAVLLPDLAVLPILPGDRPIEWPSSFPVSLAELVERRYRRFPGILRREIEDSDTFVAALQVELGELPTRRVSLIHGDLIPANVHVQDGRVVGVLDIGFMTSLGDPQFDAAITASVFDMYGPNARTSEDVLTQEFLDRFGHDHRTYALYRAAYAVITNAYFGMDGSDGHFAWCAQMLRRPDIRSAVLG